MASILNSIKKLLGITEEYTQFDTDLIIHINSVFSVLIQMGIGPVGGYAITGPENVWSEFVDDKLIECVKTSVYLRVKLLFDPPLNSFTISAIEKQIQELEWRMFVNEDIKDNDSDGKEENQNE